MLIDPETGEPIEAADPADAAVTAPEVETPDPLSAAMDKGVDEATPEVEPEPVAAPAPGTEDAKAADAKADTDKAKPAPDKDTEDEIAALGLKEKSAERFRGMAAEIKALAPIKTQLEQAGIKDVTELPQLVRHARDGADLVKMVQDTGASPEQFGMMLDYQAAISAASKGDRAAAEQAWAMWESEGRALAKALGKEVPGIHDPLAAYPDLVEMVESTDMTRKAALEVAQARAHQQAVSQHQQQTRQQVEQTQAREQAEAQGKQSLVLFDQQMLASDATYAAKRPQLNVMVSWIRQHLPPAQWAAATQQAYATIPTPAPAPVAAAKPTGNAVRPGGPRGNMAPTSFASIEDALDFGINEARAG